MIVLRRFSDHRRLVAACTLAIAMLVPAGPLAADEEGDAGRLVNLRLNTTGSDQHASFHGSIVIKRNNGKKEEYMWGGSSCPGQKMAEPQVQLLSHALSDRHKTLIVPHFKKGEADKRCLVAFELRAG